VFVAICCHEGPITKKGLTNDWYFDLKSRISPVMQLWTGCLVTSQCVSVSIWKTGMQMRWETRGKNFVVFPVIVFALRSLRTAHYNGGIYHQIFYPKYITYFRSFCFCRLVTWSNSTLVCGTFIILPCSYFAVGNKVMFACFPVCRHLFFEFCIVCNMSVMQTSEVEPALALFTWPSINLEGCMSYKVSLPWWGVFHRKV
jgi:hypothetical protein